MSQRNFFLPALFMLIAAPAMAQESALAKFQACAAVKTDADRLACYDAAAAKPVAPAAKPALAAPTGTAAIGAAPKATASQEKADNQPEQVSLVVLSVTPRADGKLRVTLENGEVWRQTDSGRIPVPAKSPITASIRKAALGSFMMTLNDGRSFRAVREK